MGLGVRARETLVISVLTLLVVGTTTAVHLSRLSRVVVEEVSRQADLVTKQIYAQSAGALSRAPRRPAAQALRRDRDLRDFLDASVGYSPHLVYVLIADTAGRILLHTERKKEDSVAPRRPELAELLRLDPVRRFAALHAGGVVYEASLPLKLNDEPFATIRLGLSTTLLKREQSAALAQSLTLAGVALPLAWIAAMLLARLVLNPIRAIAGQVDRLRRGEFLAEGGLGGGDEFQELSSQLQRLGRDLHADRIAALSEKAQLQQVVDQLEDGVVFLNPHRGIVFFNRAAEAIIGQPLNQAVGQPLADLLDGAHPLRRLVDQVFEEGGGFRNATVRVPYGGGSKECLVSACFVRDAGREIGAMALVRDLESVRTVQALVSYSAKLAALGRLTSGVAHEVKNPLNAMLIHLELLKEGLDSPTDQVQQSVEVIGGEIRRLDRAVQGFLRFMRPQEIVLKRIDLNALLQDLTTLLEADWQAHGARLALSLDPALPLIGADEELLRQLFLNLLQNAVQAMTAGGTVTLQTEPEGREWARVAISDEGVGIAPDDLDRIFKLYYTTKPEGSGIGLSIVYRIVQMHDGTIEARSEVGRGTTMTVRLPVR